MLTLQEQVRTATARADGFSDNVRELELALTAAKASLTAQQEVVTEVRAFLDAREQPPLRPVS